MDIRESFLHPAGTALGELGLATGALSSISQYIHRNRAIFPPHRSVNLITVKVHRSSLNKAVVARISREMHSQMARAIGLVMTGGGARGAYQAGVLDGLAR